MTHLEIIKLLESGKTLVERTQECDTYYKMTNEDIYTREVWHDTHFNWPKGFWVKAKEFNFRGNFKIVEVKGEDE